MNFCGRCGQRAGAPPSAQSFANTQTVRIPTHLTEAILVTIFCCLIPGVVAIVYAAQVNGKLAAGDLEGATNCSRLASRWSWAGFGLGVGALVVWFMVGVLGAMGR